MNELLRQYICLFFLILCRINIPWQVGNNLCFFKEQEFFAIDQPFFFDNPYILEYDRQDFLIAFESKLCGKNLQSQKSKWSEYAAVVIKNDILNKIQAFKAVIQAAWAFVN